MRGSTTHILARGPAPDFQSCAPPLHPPGQWLRSGHEAHPEPVERIPVQSVARRLRSPLQTFDMRAFCAPKTPDHAMEATSSRSRGVPAPCNPDQGGSTRATHPWNLPIDQIACHTLGTQTTSWRRLHRKLIRSLAFVDDSRFTIDIGYAKR